MRLTKEWHAGFLRCQREFRSGGEERLEKTESPKTTILPFIVGIVTSAFIFAGCCDDPPPSPTEVHGQYGCAASYGQAGGWGAIGVYSGNPYLDQKMNEEVFIQRQFWSGVPANVFYLDEGSYQAKNAYATQDGYILFGIWMMNHIVNSYGELPVAGVLAHEWGHRAQFVWGWHRANPFFELEADAFSGYYMALAKQWAWSEIESYYANVYATGDYYFHHPQHHGTPEQRLAAARLGVETGLEAINAGKQFTYQELHDIFVAGVGGVIIPEAIPAGKRNLDKQFLRDQGIRMDVVEDIAKGKSLGTEITYSRTLSLEERLALGPK